MTPVIREARRDELETLFPLLLLAEPSASALRWGLKNLSDTLYRMDVDGRLAGAASVRWRRDPCEMLELAILRERQGAGLGKQFVAWLVAEARRRGKPEIIVGTSTTSAANIIFYQKCGFRADHIRHDYFWYYDEPVYEHGLVVRDMLVFRLDLNVAASAEHE
ncbi:MAG TPA: GNAT family N-acetyltransferase [Pyrinomonadaceae bacterium]|nr:GNAT family N-acetyltransferase [Pyrinomonadaceae bacterium]